MAPMGTFAAHRDRRGNRTGPYAKVETQEGARFLDLDALPKGWSYNAEGQAFFLDCEECNFAGELSEKNMNAEDRAKFAEAKARGAAELLRQPALGARQEWGRPQQGAAREVPIEL
eukprot:3736805-Pyramimonas_sp.AAC.1